MAEPQRIDEEAFRLFSSYGWTLCYLIGVDTTIGDIHSLASFDANRYFFNDLSKDIGLDMLPYAGEEVQADIYRIYESLSDSKVLGKLMEERTNAQESTIWTWSFDAKTR